jgi:hypothetical protein
MQNVLIALRLLALLERQSAVVARRPVLRAKVARTWTLLANIAAFAMWGK